MRRCWAEVPRRVVTAVHGPLPFNACVEAPAGRRAGRAGLGISHRALSLQSDSQQRPPIPGPRNIPVLGQFEGAQFRIDYRDGNSMLYLDLEPRYQIKAVPGSMVAMDPAVHIQGKLLELNTKRLFSGTDWSESSFTGPGQVVLAPPAWGDIMPIRLDSETNWTVSKSAFLACTPGITREFEFQGARKAIFSSEGLYVTRIRGSGVLWVYSVGAVTPKMLQPREEYIVGKGHAVAWTAQYRVQRVHAGGFLSRYYTGEGWISHFTGPGVVYVQSRSLISLGGWLGEISSGSRSGRSVVPSRAWPQRGWPQS
ncbi:tryptophan RNA-binding attenuator protein-like domain-containing protein [Daedaleopsis nitida]|nr:tryptophan RNA-binding attenuator protein-like domain-containing protein [Daedaleopsis nitida]